MKGKAGSNKLNKWVSKIQANKTPRTLESNAAAVAAAPESWTPEASPRTSEKAEAGAASSTLLQVPEAAVVTVPDASAGAAAAMTAGEELASGATATVEPKLSKAQKWAARAAAAAAAAAATQTGVSVGEPSAPATKPQEKEAGGTPTSARSTEAETVEDLKKALADMRQQMIKHERSYNEERVRLQQEVNSARRLAQEKEAEAKEAAAATASGVGNVLKKLGELENPLDTATKTAKDGMGWLTQKAVSMARVETPEDVKRRELKEEKEKWIAEMREKQGGSSSRGEAALMRAGKAKKATLTETTKFDENGAPKGKAFVPPGGWTIDGKSGKAPSELNGWARINFNNGDYEGEFADGKPNGYGRTTWSELNMAYHGEMVQQRMCGEGTFFFGNGDMLEGVFEDHKPKGPAVLTELKTGKRYNVEYDGLKKLSEGAEPLYKTQIDEPLRLFTDHRVTITACSRGDKHMPFVGNYSHCKKAVEGKLAYCLPLRAHRPLENAGQIAGKIAVVQRGTCSYGKKLRYVQAAGAIAMLVIGTDNLEKYQQVFQIHEGDPLADDPWPEGEVPPPIKVDIPVAYSLGINEKKLPHGAYVRLRFFENAPGTPKGWLLGCIFINAQTIHPDLNSEEASNLLDKFLSARKDERQEEKMGLERRLKGVETRRVGEFDPTGENLLESFKGNTKKAVATLNGQEQVDENDLVPQVIDDLVAGYEGSMTFTVAEPPPAVYMSKKKKEAYLRQEDLKGKIRVKNSAGRRSLDSESTFEMGLGDALFALIASGKD